MTYRNGAFIALLRFVHLMLNIVYPIPYSAASNIGIIVHLIKGIVTNPAKKAINSLLFPFIHPH